ncbi:MAG TPA: aldehyde dehydrogenase family protein [Gemmatimonadales bacterium]|nr:aldehyde dehydrogenase family protein [Gemmatimonadales bacterium]
MTTVPAIDPASGLPFAETPSTPVADLPSMVEQARAAQAEWAARPLAERKRVIARFQRLFYAKRMEAAELIARENGKPVAEALLTDVAVTLDMARYYLDHAPRILRPRRIVHGNVAFLGRRGRLYWEPLGVIAIISPWNYPLLLPFGEMIPALLAGNAVILKPSEFTTRTAVLGVELLHQAGLPAALCQLAAGAGDVGAALIKAGPDKIFFTGSVRTGRLVAQTAAARSIPINLELGGSDPCLVLADADLERAASGVVWARFTNGGQTCVAAKRVIVEAPVYQRFVDLLVAKVQTLELGPGLSRGVDMGPVIRESQLREVERQLAATVARGARVRTGGVRRPDLGPTFFEPTIVTEVPFDSPLWREEVFGPVLPVVPAENVDEAIRLANDSAFGLSASIWTGDRGRGERLARRIEAGAVLVNDATSYVGAAEVPHGGEKDSGIGRSHGEFGMLETCRPRFVGSDRLDWMHKPWWFGYHADSLGARDAFLRLAFAPSLLERVKAIPGALRLLFNRRRV